jgi:hypothetical protein
MQIKLLLLIALSVACNDASSTREMFDAGGQEVITSFAGKNTMSVLYGNGGTVFTLVTWEQIAHPQWYGSNINGRLKTVETVRVNDNLTFEYKVLKGIAPENITERINFIVHQQPSVFP